MKWAQLEIWLSKTHPEIFNDAVLIENFQITIPEHCWMSNTCYTKKSREIQENKSIKC